MAYMQYLKFEYENLPLPDSYELSLTSIEADTSGETEAGTRQRDVIRQGVAEINVSFSVSRLWLGRLTAYAKSNSISVEYFDTDSLTLKSAQMYIEGFKASLEKDTSYKGLWKVSFTLKEF